MAASIVDPQLNLLPQDPAYQAIFAKEEQVLAGIRDGVISDPLVDLIRIDAAFWRKFSLPVQKRPQLVGGEVCSLLKNSWSPNEAQLDIGARLQKLNKYITPHSIVAGGAIFSILFGLPLNDVDVFFVGAEPAQATEIISKTLNNGDYVDRIARSANAVTLKVENPNFGTTGNGEVQYILRLYQSISEVIHGFDVDCCCLAYDGSNVWMTPRAYYALSNGYNTLTKERMSPSYEYRLLKYAYRGIPILIPGFDHQVWVEGKGFITSTVGSRKLRKILRKERAAKRHGFMYLVVMAQMIARYPRGAVQLLYIENKDKNKSDYSGASNDGHIFGILPMQKVLGNRYWQFLSDSKGIDDRGITITGKEDIISYVGRGEDAEDILHIPDDIYEFIQDYYTSYPPQEIVYKVVRPGEQATGSFHKIVLDDPTKWWTGY